jgi:hypothetical protein
MSSQLVAEIMRAHKAVESGRPGARRTLERLQAEFRRSGTITRYYGGEDSVQLTEGGASPARPRRIERSRIAEPTREREPIELRRGRSPITVDLSSASKEAIEAEILHVRRQGDWEAAGFLFAPKRPSYRSDSVSVCLATHAGDDSRHSWGSVQLGDPYELQASFPPELQHVMRVGDWHSHNIPESDVPSETDMRAWAGNCDALALPFYVGVIASPARDGGWMLRSLTPWVTRREGYPSKLVCERAVFRW